MSLQGCQASSRSRGHTWNFLLYLSIASDCVCVCVVRRCVPYGCGAGRRIGLTRRIRSASKNPKGRRKRLRTAKGHGALKQHLHTHTHASSVRVTLLCNLIGTHWPVSSQRKNRCTGADRKHLEHCMNLPLGPDCKMQELE